MARLGPKQSCSGAFSGRLDSLLQQSAEADVTFVQMPLVGQDDEPASLEEANQTLGASASLRSSPPLAMSSFGMSSGSPFLGQTGSSQPSQATRGRQPEQRGGLTRADSSADPAAKRSATSRQPPIPTMSAHQEAQKLSRKLGRQDEDSSDEAAASTLPAKPTPPRPQKQQAKPSQPPMPSFAAVQAAQDKFSQALGGLPSPKILADAGSQPSPSGFSFGNLSSGPPEQAKRAEAFNFGLSPQMNLAAAPGELAFGLPAKAAMPGTSSPGAFNFTVPTKAAAAASGSAASGSEAVAAAAPAPPIPSMSAVRAAQRLSESQQQKLSDPAASVQDPQARAAASSPAAGLQNAPPAPSASVAPAPQPAAKRPAASQPPLPSMAAVKQAQQLTKQLEHQQPGAPGGVRMAGGSTSAKSASVQPPLPSMAAVKDAQAAAAESLGKSASPAQSATGMAPSPS